MPRKIYDPRLLMLTMQATTKVSAVMSLDQAPDALVPRLDPASPGYPWGWADVTVSTSFGGQSWEVTLKGQSYADERAFLQGEAYQTALIKCLSALLAKLDHAADLVKALGPRRVVQ